MNCILFAAVAFAFVLACYAENNVPSEVISIAASSTANQYATSWSYTFSAVRLTLVIDDRPFPPKNSFFDCLFHIRAPKDVRNPGWHCCGSEH